MTTLAVHPSTLVCQFCRDTFSSRLDKNVHATVSHVDDVPATFTFCICGRDVFVGATCTCGRLNTTTKKEKIMTTIPRFPDVEVELVGHDGNAFAILGNVRRALLKGGATKGDVESFMTEAMAGDYDHLLRTCTRWVVVS